MIANRRTYQEKDQTTYCPTSSSRKETCEWRS